MKFKIGNRIRAMDNGRTGPRFANKEGTIIAGPSTSGGKRVWDVRYDNGIGNQSGVITPEEDMELICFKVGDRIRMKDIPDVPSDFRGEEGTIESEETRPPLSGPKKKRWNVNFDNVSSLPVTQNPVVVPENHMDMISGTFGIGVRVKMKDKHPVAHKFRNEKGVITSHDYDDQWIVKFDNPRIGNHIACSEANMIILTGSSGNVHMVKHTKEVPIDIDMCDEEYDERIEDGDRVILRHGNFYDFKHGTTFKITQIDYDEPFDDFVELDDEFWTTRERLIDNFLLITEYEVRVDEGPKNNDGRATCVFCGAPTRDYGAVGGMMPMGKVCTVCNR